MSAISVLLIVTIWQHHVQTFDVIPVPFQHPTSVSHKTKAEVVTSTKTFGVKHSHMVAVLLAQKEAQCLEIYVRIRILVCDKIMKMHVVIGVFS